MLLLSLVAICSCEIFYIVPVNSAQRCEEETCLTIDQLGEVMHQSFSNLTLYFLPGQHYLASRHIVINYVKNVTITGSLSNTEVWLQQSTFTAAGIKHLAIENLTFASSYTEQHGSVEISKSEELLITGCKFRVIGMSMSSYNATITRCTFENNLSFHYDAVPLGNTSNNYLHIINSNFIDNAVSATVKVKGSQVKINIIRCIFTNNYSNKDGGAVTILADEQCVVYISGCSFAANSATNRGGALFFLFCMVYIHNTSFSNNTAKEGGAISGPYGKGTMEIINCRFINKHNTQGVINTQPKCLLLTNCKFEDCITLTNKYTTVNVNNFEQVFINDSIMVNNYGSRGGGISLNFGKDIYITNCTFVGNHAGYGGALYSIQTYNLTILGSTFTSNSAEKGGAIKISNYKRLKIINCLFSNNYGKNEAAVSMETETGKYSTTSISGTHFLNNSGSDPITIVESSTTIENTHFAYNQADTKNHVITLLHSSVTLERATFTENKGHIYSFHSRVDITGPVIFSDNSGGALCAVQSQIYINSTEEAVIINNTASLGGGITLHESDLIILSPLRIFKNKASKFGGGIYAYKSRVEYISKQRTTKSFIINNIAGQSGGGVYAVASTIKLTKQHVTISFNTALLSGGGIYLSENSQIYLFKLEPEELKSPIKLQIMRNYAVFGGGIYVADNSTTRGLQCGGKSPKEKGMSQNCFIQTIKLYVSSKIIIPTKFENTFLINNQAETGSALYGGLLDRCTVSTQAEVYKRKFTGLKYIKQTVKISHGSSITSDPLQILFCGKSPSIIFRKKGETFKLNVSAIDQIGNPLNGTIHSSLVTESGVGRLKEGQAEQNVGDRCTELEYNVFSQDSSAQVELYADGPCDNLGISKQSFRVVFLPCTCPIGLQPSQSQIDCQCVCDNKLQPYHIIICNQTDGTVELETNIWINGVSSINGPEYIIQSCPFDYCVEKPVNISLNSSQERDRQCAFNRSGVLCGECQQGLSLVLATSKCKECSNVYLLLTIPFALAGIALVVFILFFNITIATGTIHGLIFYSNLLPVNYFTQPSALTVFISWVNLDLGIETCFYNGMSSQAKVLLQLVFPTFLFLLIFLIIILSRYFNFFATLLSNRNPVAALCTLIFMSYSKLVQFIIAALQSTVLDLPGHIKQRVWTYDANVQYLTPSHTPQFVAAVLILMAGGLFTLLLFFAQWLPRCYKWKLMRWTRHTKYTAFIDAYHAPFTCKHRYWVGLLLFALIIHNVLAAMATNDFLPILSMGCTAIGLLILKLVCKRVHKSWFNDLLETAFLLNLVFLAYATLYVLLAGTSYVTGKLANVSMGLSACLLLIILCYHSYKHVCLKSRFYRKHKRQISDITTTVRKNLRQGPKRQGMEAIVTDQRDTLATGYTALRSELDVLAPITTDDYIPASLPHTIRTEVTHTVVERVPDTLNTGEQTNDTVNNPGNNK